MDFFDLIDILFGAVYDLFTYPLYLPDPVGSTSALNIGIFFGLLSLMVYGIQRFFGFVGDESGLESEEEAFEREVEESIHRMDVNEVAHKRRGRNRRG